MIKIINYLKNKVDQYEIFHDDFFKETCELNKNQIDTFTLGNSGGIGIRVYLNGKIGFSNTSNIKNYQKCCDDAIKTAKLNEKDKDFVRFVKPGKYKKDKYYSKNVLNFNVDKIKDYVNETIEIINNNKIKLTSGRYLKLVRKNHIINSEGVDIKQLKTWNYINYDLLDEKNNISYSGGEESFDKVGFKKLDESIQRLNSLKIRETPKTEDMKLILHPEALSDLLDSFLGHNLNAEEVQNKRSCFAGKLNKKIFSEKFNVIDDGTIEGYNISSRCDSEGTPRKRINLFDNGELKSFLHNSYTANKEKIENTGHGSRDFASIPSISSTNIIVKPGNSKFNDIINIKKGIYVKQLLGVHTMNSMTGEFSLGIIEGHIIENGEIKNAVKDTMIAGNIFDLLKNIESIENKNYYGGSGYYVPHILFNKIKVIGK